LTGSPRGKKPRTKGGATETGVIQMENKGVFANDSIKTGPNEIEGKQYHPEKSTKAGGNEMEEKETRTEKKSARPGLIDTLSELRNSVFNLGSAKKVAAWYIDTNEKLAKNALEFQAAATQWAKDTPLEPIFEAQNEFGRKLVERSADAARTLWRLN
jgi:hypothetical protein